MSISNNTTKLNLLKELIETLPIPENGGGGAGSLAGGYSYGTFQVSSSSTHVTITHGLGVIPGVIIVAPIEGAGYSNSALVDCKNTILSIFVDRLSAFHAFADENLMVYTTDDGTVGAVSFDTTDSFIELNNSIGILKAGSTSASFSNKVPYGWLAFKNDVL